MYKIQKSCGHEKKAEKEETLSKEGVSSFFGMRNEKLSDILYKENENKFWKNVESV